MMAMLPMSHNLNCILFAGHVSIPPFFLSSVHLPLPYISSKDNQLKSPRIFGVSVSKNISLINVLWEIVVFVHLQWWVL